MIPGEKDQLQAGGRGSRGVKVCGRYGQAGRSTHCCLAIGRLGTALFRFRQSAMSSSARKGGASTPAALQQAHLLRAAGQCSSQPLAALLGRRVLEVSRAAACAYACARSAVMNAAAASCRCRWCQTPQHAHLFMCTVFGVLAGSSFERAGNPPLCATTVPTVWRVLHPAQQVGLTGCVHT